MSRYTFSLACTEDDAQLRERMAADWIEGDIAISLRREPSYFAASRLQGSEAQVVVGRDTATGRIVAAISRSITTVFLDGQPRRVGFLSDLRIHREHRNGLLLARIFHLLRVLDQNEPLPSFALIYDDNERALASLTGARAGLPLFRPCGRQIALAIHVRRRRPALPSTAELRRARAAELPALVQFLNRHRVGYRWAPVLAVDDFLPGGRCDTLRAEDFFVAARAGQLCAVMAAWDQSTLRQVHVERYARQIAWMRPAYNAFAALRGLPMLPACGNELSYLYLSFIAIENDDLTLCAALLRHVYNALCGGRWLYALAALAENDPLLPVFSGYSATTSTVGVFEVDFRHHGSTQTPPSVTPHARVEFALT
ncbi:hypothetical protein JOE11_001639 [Robbsia andropogonis]|uniref:hypothetical protein n=1 Tax=Robbsia andropogonis TaxID=28092 RepID=UPI003D233CA7